MCHEATAMRASVMAYENCNDRHQSLRTINMKCSSPVVKALLFISIKIDLPSTQI